MARCVLGPRKVAKLAIRTFLPVFAALTRGGTDHRIDLLLADGSVINLYKDGSMGRDSLLRWRAPELLTGPH